MLILHSLLLAIATSFSPAPLATPLAGNDAMDKARLSKLLDAGDDELVIATFRRHPGQTLPFIDSYLEGGLALLEKEGPTKADAMLASFRVGVRFAKLADQAFGGDTFTHYASAFASWSPSEQKSFREGQRLFKQGMQTAKSDPKGALETMYRSLALATALGDLWGQAMAQQGVAEIALATGGPELREEASTAAQAAVQLNKALRLVDDWAQSLRVCANVASAGGAEENASMFLMSAWMEPLSLPGADPELAKAIVDELVQQLERTGQKDQVPAWRRQFALRFPAAPASGGK